MVAFSVLLLVPIGLDNAFAATIEIKDQATCQALGGNFFGTPGVSVCFFGSFTVDADDTLNIENLVVQIGSGGFSNSGNVVLVGGSETNSGTLNLIQGASLVNECGATITAQGGDGLNSGSILAAAQTGETITNFGTINLNGGDGQASAALLIGSGTIVNNHGTINENPGSGPFSGIIRLLGTGVFNDDLPDECTSEIVGGEFLSIDTTALMLAGLQSSAIWMLPVLAGAAGVGAFYIKTRMNKDN